MQHLKPLSIEISFFFLGAWSISPIYNPELSTPPSPSSQSNLDGKSEQTDSKSNDKDADDDDFCVWFFRRSIPVFKENELVYGVWV